MIVKRIVFSMGMTSITPALSRKIAQLSFISIILVVFIHARTTDSMEPRSGPLFVGSFIAQNFIGDGIARVAVPLFFAFSGFLFFASLKPTAAGFRSKFRSRVRTLVIPYLAWNGMGLLLLMALQLLHGGASFSGEKIIWHYSAIDLLGRIYPHPVQFQFWFILDLVVYLLVSPLLFILLKRIGPIVLLALAVLYFSKICKIYLHISDAALHTEGMLFFALGAWAAINDIPLRHLKKRTAIALGLLWTALCFGKTLLLLSSGETYSYNLIHRATVIIGLAAVWGLYDHLPARIIAAEIWGKLTPCTFFLYAFHEPAQTIIRNEIYRMISSGPVAHAVSFVVCPVLTIAVAILLAQALMVRTPRFFAVITGGRGSRQSA